LQVLQLFTTASGFSSDAHASPAPNLSGDTWLLVVMTGVDQRRFFAWETICAIGHVVRAAQFRVCLPDRFL
jgi:hypothetical protein